MEKTVNTSLIVGAGAIENAWKPIIKAMEPHYELKLDGDCANSIFARIVYLLRWFGSIDEISAKEYLKNHLDFANELKVKIAKELMEAENSGELKPRPQFEEIVKKFVLVPNNRFVVISTNWDTVIDKAINVIAKCDFPNKGSDILTHHVHGSINEPRTMYLPTEVTRENYRTEKEDEEIGTNHSSLWQTIEKSQVSILYGLSLSPLDAELAQTLAVGWANKNLEKIIIIDPDHLVISKRVKCNLQEPKKIKIFGFHPNDLERKIDHSE